jgi:hypothetical protein
VAEGVLVGRVAAVLRYPVKSVAAEPVEEVDVSWHGLSGDRRWAFVRPDLPSNGVPWLTLRQRNDRFDVAAPDLAAELDEGVRVMTLIRGTFDTMPLSLITTRTVESLDAACYDPSWRSGKTKLAQSSVQTLGRIM